jgi:hypothetical protein
VPENNKNIVLHGCLLKNLTGLLFCDPTQTDQIRVSCALSLARSLSLPRLLFVCTSATTVV